MDHKTRPIAASIFRPQISELKNAPWGEPMENWREHYTQVTELPQGISRHPVSFINCHANLLAIKQMPAGFAKKEFDLLEKIENLRLPVVIPAGFIQLDPPDIEPSYLVTFYLARSIPYRILFMSPSGLQSRAKLLDAMAGLLVQLHLSGVYWGDCSLSNTLFRHDAGALQAYLVDAESAEIYESQLSPPLRFQDLQIMEDNVTSEMMGIKELGIDVNAAAIYETGKSLRHRYHQLWEEITKEVIIHPSENYRIQERIRSLNNLGYSVKDIALRTTDDGDQLRLRIIVADRSFHRNQLFDLTGLEVEEMQARLLVNEIMEVRAILSREQDSDIPIEAAAYHWNIHFFTETLEKLKPLIEIRQDNESRADSGLTRDPVEMYCQVLEHKWYLSERSHHDVGHRAATLDYIKTMMEQNLHLPNS
jgi:hypothetical protein